MSIIQVTTKQTDKIPLDPFGSSCNAVLMDGKDVFKNWNNIDCVIVWGYLRGQHEIVHWCINENKDFYYVDHSYFNQTRDFWTHPVPNASFRIIKNRIQPEYKEYDDNRFKTMGININDTIKGNTLLYLPPSDNWLDCFPHSVEWNDRAEQEARDYCTNNNMTFNIRKKGTPGPVVWDDVGIVATYNSNLAVDALQKGIKVAVSGESSCASVSLKIGPSYEVGNKTTQELFNLLSYRQFTINEMKSGYAWKVLNDS